jgi:methyltransferase (TIGR00027 family)
MRPYVAARTRFFDEELIRAYDRGVRQVVIVGAGYDGRSLRFRRPGVTFFEVDHPVTQADKLRRFRALAIDASDVRFVPLDIGRTSITDALGAAGHERSAPTLFMCEGVTPYVPMADLRSLVAHLSDVASPSSSLAIDFFLPTAGRSAVSRALVGAVRMGTAVMGEPVITMLTREDAEVLLTRARWSQLEWRSPALAFPAAFAEASAK